MNRRLAFDTLDERNLPSAESDFFLTSSAGIVAMYTPNGERKERFRPFESGARDIPLFLAVDAERIYVGAGVGGAPRVQVRDRIDTSRVLLDFFAGSEESRTGVSVAVPGQVFAGNLSSKPNAPNSLILDADLLAADVAAVWSRVSRELAEFPIDVRTSSANQFADDMRTAVIRIADGGGRSIAGEAPLGVFSKIPLAKGFVFTDSLDEKPNLIASAALHEFGHLIGLEHTNDSRSIMFPRTQNLDAMFLPDEKEVIRRILA